MNQVQSTQVETVKIETVDLTSFTTKSAKIRHLHSLNYSRGDIAKHLKIRYQHVRNVLITPIKNQ